MNHPIGHEAGEKMASFRMRYDDELGALIVEVTDNVAFTAMKMIRTHLWPEVEHMHMETFDYIGDSGFEFKNVRRYIIPCYADRCDIFFDAAKSALADSIKNSIPNSDN